MYKRPRPILPKVQPPPAVLTQAEAGTEQLAWRTWHMAPIQTRKEPEDEAPKVPEIDHEAVRAQELARQVQMIKDQARAEGLAQGQAEGYAKGIEQGKSEGHEAGYKAGLSQANEEQLQAASRLVQLVERSEHDFQQIQETMGQALIQMGTQIAGHILQTELKDPIPSLLAVVNGILRQNENTAGAVTLYLNADDLALVRDSLPDTYGEATVRLVASPDLNRGDVKARTAYGDIDATLATRWKNAMASIGLNTSYSGMINDSGLAHGARTES